MPTPAGGASYLNFFEHDDHGSNGSYSYWPETGGHT
ncbi:MAG: hypothetical protein QOI10_3945 [Solirubrobacterales bacterium]|nr:hypothetical protein [Solirubrobacterales bacterium]